MKNIFLFLIVILFFTFNAFAAVKAFPGAEGSGCWATGGRGGSIYEVTNLSNSGAGSIVDAVSQPNRIIVFRVSGTIELGSVILLPKSNTTIAGQTAPGDGICLKGRIHIKNNAHDIIIRYIRVRVDSGGKNSSGDAIDIDEGYNIIIDHVSASYSRDETISCQEDTDNITVQWCILSEALTFESHSYGSLIRGEYGQEKTYHHNLYVHNKGRNPRPGNYTSAALDPEGLHFDFRNNVIYNWDGGTPGYNADTTSTSRYNFINNVYIAGAESSGTKIFKEDSKTSYGYFSGNIHGTTYNNTIEYTDQWRLVVLNGFAPAEMTAYRNRSYLIPMESVTTTSAQRAKADALANAGVIFPVRDAVDTRIVNDVLNDTGHSISDITASSWPTLNSLPPPTDSDHDGMPDWWELKYNLNPNDNSDHNGDFNGDGYTNVEKYINGLCPDPFAPRPNPMSWAQTPYASNAYAISMTATSASDACGVEYYFANLTIADGSHDSGWQDSTAYTDTGLNDGVTYTYQAWARSKNPNHNETIPAPEYSATATRFVCTSIIESDLDGDCKVDFIDLNILASEWENEWTDILQFAENWLKCNRFPSVECGQ